MLFIIPLVFSVFLDTQVKRKLEEVKAKKEASNPDDYLPDGIDRRILEAQVRRRRMAACWGCVPDHVGRAAR